LGGAGGALGYGPDPTAGVPGIGRSVAIKFDLYNNEGEGTNSTGLFINGATPTRTGSIGLSKIDLHSGHVFFVSTIYDGTRLAVTIIDSQTGISATQNYTINIPDTVGAADAYVGFTGSTGFGSAKQEILAWTWAKDAASLANGHASEKGEESIGPGIAIKVGESGARSDERTAPRQTDARNPEIVPIAHWTLDDVESGTVRDSVGTAHDGKVIGDVRSAPGVIGKAAVFDGNLAMVLVEDHPKFHFKTAVSVSAWVKPSTKHGTIVGKWYAMDAYTLEWRENAYRFSIALPVGGKWGTGLSVEAPASPNVWSHVAGVYDGYTLALYVNGLLKVKNIVQSGRKAAVLQDSDRPITIGNHPPWEAFLGMIDEVRLYDVALSEKEIRQLARIGIPPDR
jgi:hypothetical protein